MLIHGGTISSGRLIDLGRGRLVLDELDQLVAEDHLAGGRGEVDAELERARVGLANAQVAVAGLDVLGQHFEAPHEVLAALGERRAHELRIGGDEVRGRQRRRDLAQIELRLVAVVRLEFVGALDQIVRPARRQHVGLLDEIEIRIVAPGRRRRSACRRRRERRSGSAFSPCRRCSVAAQRSTNWVVSAACAANARWGSAM